MLGLKDHDGSEKCSLGLLSTTGVAVPAASPVSNLNRQCFFFLGANAASIFLTESSPAVVSVGTWERQSAFGSSPPWQEASLSSEFASVELVELPQLSGSAPNSGSQGS